MTDLVLEAPTVRTSMEEIRPTLEAALREQFPGGMLRWSWDGDTLRLSGPGAEGTIALEGASLVGRAKLGVPASLMRPMIEQKMTAVMQKASA